MIEARKQKLNKYDINFNEFTKYTGISSFEVPKKLKRFYGTYLSSEECFYLISNVVFDQCDLLTGQKASFLEQDTFTEWAKRVGEKRADNFKAAVFEEVKFRIFSNTFPEFANETSLQNPVFSTVGERKEYKIISQILSPQAANYIISSHWNIVDFEGAQDYINNFEQYLDKFVYKPFYKDLGSLRALMIAKELSLQTRIGEVSNLVAHHYAEFIFTKQIQEDFNRNVKQHFTDLEALVDAKELALLMKILEVKTKYEEDVKALQEKDTSIELKISEIEEQQSQQDKKLNTLELENQTQQEQLSNLDSKHVALESELVEFKTTITNEQELQNQDIQSATELVNENVVKTSEIENNLHSLKVNFIAKSQILDEQQTQQDNKIAAIENKLPELANNSDVENLKTEMGNKVNELNTKFNNLPNLEGILTKTNLNAEARTLSALTIAPGNGTHNSSIFLKNGKANWEFYADSNNGSFGVWDKLKNREAFNISTERKVDFYNEINLHGYKIVNVATPTTDKDAANKKYVDDKINTLTGLDFSTITPTVPSAGNNSSAQEVNDKEAIKTFIKSINPEKEINTLEDFFGEAKTKYIYLAVSDLALIEYLTSYQIANLLISPYSMQFLHFNGNVLKEQLGAQPDNPYDLESQSFYGIDEMKEKIKLIENNQLVELSGEVNYFVHKVELIYFTLHGNNFGTFPKGINYYNSALKYYQSDSKAVFKLLVSNITGLDS